MDGSAEKKRGALLTIWLILLLLANIVGVVTLFLGAKSPASLFQLLPSWILYSLGVLSVLNLVFIIFLFMWKKWAFFALIVTAIIAAILHLVTLSIFSSIFELVAVFILWLILRPKWSLLE